MLSKPSVITTSFFPSDGIQFHAHHRQCNAATFTPPLLHPRWISSPTLLLRDTLCKGTSSVLCSQPLPFLSWISWHSPPNLPSYCSHWFFSTFMKIWAAAQTSARFGCGNDLSVPLCCFPSFRQLFIHARNLWRLFPVRPLGEALFQMPLWIPWGPYHPDLFVHLPGDSFKGFLKICEPCPPFSFLNTELQHFEGCLLASNNLFYPMICHVSSPLVFLK